MRCKDPLASLGSCLGFFAVATSALSTGYDSETFPHPALVPKPTFRNLCPVPCSDAGPTGFSWSVVPSVSALKQCNETLLIEASLVKSITTTDEENTIRACSAPGSSSRQALASDQRYGPPCLPSVELRSAKVNVEIGCWQETVDGSRASDIVNATLQLQKNVIEDPNCEATALSARSGDAVVGLWIGGQIRKTSATGLIERFIALVESKEGPLPKKAAAQVCGSTKGQPASQNFGIFYDASSKIGDVFGAVQGWAEAVCLEMPSAGETWKGEHLSIIPGLALTMGADAVLSPPKDKNSSVTSVASSVVAQPTYSVTSLSLGPSASVSVAARGDHYDLYDPYDDLNIDEDGLEDRDEECRAATVEAIDGGNITVLNPCPLNVCSNIWGQCGGTTKDFCVDTTVDKTPGTAQKGTYGCISNCGMDSVNNKVGPDKFRALGYFEGWNMDRPCLNMDTETIPQGQRHHPLCLWMIGEDFSISIGPRRRTSSTTRCGSPPTVVNFISANGLDGVDFDWEYPGATDIEGSQPGTPEDGKNYLAFLGLVRRHMSQGKTIAIAAPASYCYLKAFPIAEISKIVDYIIYMTYDLHGQWDVGNKWASDGCPGANCLRSHVNLTLTQGALSMVTKAGVPSNKIMVGVSSYGRGFKMAEKSCEGPSCFFLGGRNQSPAKPGVCTGTSGYTADAEMMQITRMAKAGFDSTEMSSYHDDSSDSDIFHLQRRRVGVVDEARDKGQPQATGAVDLSVDVGRANTESSLLNWPTMDLGVNCPLDTTYDTLDALDAVAGGRFTGLNAKKNEMTTKQKENMGKSYSANTPKVQSIMGKSCGTK
ncbi:hypothetical protein ACHAQH_006919 [Verticillium albo-atrum]